MKHMPVLTNNQMKTQTLSEMKHMMEVFFEKKMLLRTLDNDSSTSGHFDLHDQLHVMDKQWEDLKSTVTRAMLVVPQNN